MSRYWLWRGALLLTVLSCNGSDAGEGEAMSSDEIQARVDSLNQVAAERLARRPLEILNEPADYMGAVVAIESAGDRAARRVTLRYELSGGQPAVGSRNITFTIRGDSAVWRQDQSVLPVDSLQIGDLVRVWLLQSAAMQPSDPPYVGVRAVQRLDSLTTSTGPARPAA